MVSSSEFAVEQLAQVCQVLAGQVLDWSDPPDPVALSDAFAIIPQPDIEIHALAVEQLLSCVTTQLSAAIHRNFYARFRAEKCHCDLLPFQPVRSDGNRLHVSENLLRWATAFQAEFFAGHNSVSQRARRMIDGSEGKGPTIDAMARALGVGRRVLERQFQHEVGVSIAEYRIRVRLRAAVRQLSQTPCSVESVALNCGWTSKKGLYDAFARLTVITPAQVRELSSGQIERLLASVGPLAAPRPQ
jgi:AraC-like DNA-binding protein